jgi:predicted negative regulator of RcsB-dependent stress response
MNKLSKSIIAALVIAMMLLAFFSEQSSHQVEKQRTMALKVQVLAEEQANFAEEALEKANRKIEDLEQALEKCQSGE